MERKIEDLERELQESNLKRSILEGEVRELKSKITRLETTVEDIVKERRIENQKMSNLDMDVFKMRLALDRLIKKEDNED